MRPSIEALALGLASLVVLAVQYLALLILGSTDAIVSLGGIERLVGLVVNIIGVGGLTTLGYVAGRRGLPLGVVAIVGFQVAASLALSVTWR